MGGRQLRAVFVNHCHPGTAHVCAVRAREFADALAQRGHRIVLLTETLRPDDPAETASALSARLAAHDWSAPLHLACRPAGHAFLRRQRAGRLPPVLSKAVVAAYYAGAGSVFADWGRGAAPYIPVLAEAFRPDVVWANFGNTECLRIGRRIARRSACPWVMDVKDYWSTFIPRPFRLLLGRRFGDPHALTALSHGHVADIRPAVGTLLADRATVIYSGVPEALLADRPAAAVESRRVMIVGALYDRAALDRLVGGIAAAGAGPGGPIAVDYAGDEGASVVSRATGRAGISGVVDHGYLPLDRLHDLQRTALANIFVRSGPGWFQHKVPELLAAGRPVLSLPGSDAETREMARQANVPFFNCETEADVAAALAAAGRPGTHRPERAFLAELGWARRSAILESALAAACR